MNTGRENGAIEGGAQDCSSMTTGMNRRTFLQGSSLSALAGVWPDRAYARNPAVTSATGSVALNHNGGRSQVNLNFLQTGRYYPFINFLKMPIQTKLGAHHRCGCSLA
jgi:hypothetical protein